MIIPGHKLEKLGVITPFNQRTVFNGMSYGVGPAGYDVRVNQELFLKPADFVLASTVEYFSMPKDVIGFVHDKSTWARKGLSAFNTVIEPGWKGYLTLELVNVGHTGLYIPKGSPIVQIVFMRLEEETDKPYTGKYQDQGNYPVEAILENIS